MKTATTIFSVINILLSIVSFIPCLMAGVMSMDSPQAQNSWVAHAVSNTLLTFPLVCLICGIIPSFIISRYGLIISVIPICETVLFFLTLYILSNGK